MKHEVPAHRVLATTFFFQDKEISAKLVKQNDPRKHFTSGIPSRYFYVIYHFQLITDHNQHSVSFTLNRSQAIIVQYDHDDDTDMYQVGRSSESPIDFVVMDTVPGAKRAEDCVVTQSTISRFACRILVDRNPPHTARIYAAGFDSGRNIFLGVSRLQNRNSCSCFTAKRTPSCMPVRDHKGSFSSFCKCNSLKCCDCRKRQRNGTAMHKR